MRCSSPFAGRNTEEKTPSPKMLVNDICLQTLYKSHSQLLAWNLPENSPSWFWLSLQNQAGSCPLECSVFQGIEVVQAPQDNAPAENLKTKVTKSVKKTPRTPAVCNWLFEITAVLQFPCCCRNQGGHSFMQHPSIPPPPPIQGLGNS